ncbi:MAG TPA: PilZ domain-containing protein [Polyangiales bacterium]|nr:PilZ domain-containing protein [Polyangiales bacterium]
MASKPDHQVVSSEQPTSSASAEGNTRADPRRPRRLNPRYPVRRAVELRLPDGSRKGYEMRDVSAGGVFVSAATALPLFSELHLLVRVRDETCAIPARVVHVVTLPKASMLKIVPGMGLQFEPQSDQDTLAISQLVSEAQERDPRRRVPRLIAGADLRSLGDPMLGYVAGQVDGVRSPEAIAEALELELDVAEALLRELVRVGAIELVSSAASGDQKSTSDRATPSAESGERGAGKLDPVARARLDTLAGVVGDADHYAVLGVAASASRPEISAAFVELSRVLHPDSHIGRVSELELALVERTYARIVEAYGVLSRPAARAEFDEYMDRRRGRSPLPPPNGPGSERALLERCLAEAERAHREGRPSDAERHVNQLRSLPVGPEDRERVDRVCALVLGALAQEYQKQAQYEERHQKWSEAARSWQRVSEGRPNDPEPWRHAALAMLAAEGDLRRVIELAKRAVELAPLDAHSRRVLGHAYLAAGMKRSARDELETAVRLSQQLAGDRR